MIRTQLFRRYYAITTIVVLFFLGLGFFISNATTKFALNHQPPHFPGGPGPDAFFARAIDGLEPRNHVLGLKRLEGMSDRSLPFYFLILDATGKNLSSSEPLPFSWESVKKPAVAYQFEAVKLIDRGPTHPPFEDGLIRFAGEPAQYLYVAHRQPLTHHNPPPFLIFITSASLLLSVFMGVGFALMLLFRSMREKMLLADSVITEMKNGNLKARFPIDRMDEMGQAMTRFNKMADEIERLVERLRNVEKSRMILLQDLTHDLRTPIASLKNLLATTEKKQDTADQPIRSELLTLAQKEVDYFERLVEDLLVLAQVSEPRYQASRETVSVIEIAEEEADRVSQSDSKEIQVKNELGGESDLITGDVHLLRRLFRNALENAYSFSKESVTLRIGVDTKGSLSVAILDDGPGLSEAALKGFGERRVSRAIERSQGNRLSLGLGSVIMKTVVELHGGKLVAGNRTDSSGAILGARIQFTLPRS